VEKRLLYPPGFEAPWGVMAEHRTIARHLDEMMADERVRIDEQGVYSMA